MKIIYRRYRFLFTYTYSFIDSRTVSSAVKNIALLSGVELLAHGSQCKMQEEKLCHLQKGVFMYQIQCWVS